MEASNYVFNMDNYVLISFTDISRKAIPLDSFYKCKQTFILPVITIKPVDTGRKLNVHKTLRRRRGRLLNVLCTVSLRPASTGKTFILIDQCRNCL